MRPRGGEERQGATEYKTSEERDAALESMYTYDRGDAPSTMAFIGEHKEAIALEFLDWRHGLANEKWQDDLVRFEVHRFGNPLDVGAHGLLAFEVRFQMFPADRRYSNLIRPNGAKTKPSWGSVEKIAKAHEMPHTRMSNRERDEQLAKLRSQIEGGLND